MIVKIIGWKKGLQKIPLNRLLREYSADFSLASAKKAVDDILDGKVIEFQLSEESVKEFAVRADELGAIVEINSHR